MSPPPTDQGYSMGQPGAAYPPPPPGYAPYFGHMRMRRQYPIETKPFFLTSEFVVALVATIALLITAATDSTIDSRMFWILETAIVCLYMVSRGIAKSGTRSFAPEPREHLNFGRRRFSRRRGSRTAEVAESPFKGRLSNLGGRLSQRRKVRP
jgi:hypothetical protein